MTNFKKLLHIKITVHFNCNVANSAILKETVTFNLCIKSILKNHTDPYSFIGIGGISMSGLAEIPLLEEGFTVIRFRFKRSLRLHEARSFEGAHIFYGQKVENITRGYSVVLFTLRRSIEIIQN